MDVRPFFVTPPTSLSSNFPKPRAETVSPAERSLSGFTHSRQFTWTFPLSMRAAALPRAIRNPEAATASSRKEETVSRASLQLTAGMWRFFAPMAETVSLGVYQV